MATILLQEPLLKDVHFLHLLDVRNCTCWGASAKICQTFSVKDESSGSFSRLRIQERAGWISSETLCCGRLGRSRLNLLLMQYAAAVRKAIAQSWGKTCSLSYFPISSSLLATKLSFSLMLLCYHTNNNVIFFYKPMRLVFAFLFSSFVFELKRKKVTSLPAHLRTD